MLWNLLTFLVVGFIVGMIARLIVSGPSPKGCLPTALLGIVGSFVGGFIGWAIFGGGDGPIQTSRILGSVLGAVIVLLVYRRFADDR